MADEATSLRKSFADAELARAKLEQPLEAGALQLQIQAALSAYHACLKIRNDVSLFSPNEDLEDITSEDLKYLLVDFWLGDLTLRRPDGEREDVLRQAARRLEAFLNLLDNYGILSKDDLRAFERYQEAPAKFSISASSDPVERRQLKITKYKEEKALKEKLEVLRRDPRALHNDDSLLRSLHLGNIALRKQQTFQHFESIALELQVLALAPSMNDGIGTGHAPDARAPVRNGTGNYSDRLDPPISELLRNGRGGPILAQDGRPLRPFTLLDTRSRMQQGVFRPDHSLPTMTIDEYLAEEMRRGGIIDGGGPASAARPEPDDDDQDAADAATMKARAWDEFVEENPRGAGNRVNNG